MLRVKSVIVSLFCFVILAVSVPVSAATVTQLVSSENKYVEQYFKEKKEREQKNEFRDRRDYLVDPDIEERNFIDSLNYYYEEDVKTANILSEVYKDSTILNKATSLVKEERIEIVQKIVKAYNLVEDNEQQQLLREYLGRYSYNLEDDLSIAFLEGLNQLNKPLSLIDKNEDNAKRGLKEETGKVGVLSSSYDGTAAGNWAYNNYNKYSTNFPAFTAWGSDCTNFVSQAMNVGGGKAMEGDWYITKKNSTYLVPQSAAELNYSWSLSDPSPWISVVQFTNYWGPKSVNHHMSKIYYRDNHTTVYNRSIYKGDVVVLSKGIAGFILNYESP